MANNKLNNMIINPFSKPLSLKKTGIYRKLNISAIIGIIQYLTFLKYILLPHISPFVYVGKAGKGQYLKNKSGEDLLEGERNKNTRQALCIEIRYIRGIRL